MNLSRVKNHFAHWREWEPNPIVVKELRQAVRSWTVTGMLLLFLTVLFIVSVSFLVSQTLDRNQNLQLGGELFAVFAFILGVSSILFIPLYLGVRVAAERVESNLDLLYVSTLSPVRIIFGKFLCGAYVTLLFFSACLPFMAFTNLLRGVDLPTIFFTMFVLFLVVCGINQINIFLACLPIGRPLKVLLALISLILCFSLASSMTVGLMFVRGRGIGAMMTERDFWVATAAYIAVGAAFVGLFFVLSVTLIAPPSANRAVLPRLYVTAFWVLGFPASLIVVARLGDIKFMAVWGSLTLLTMAFALPVCASNSDRFSPRTRQQIPAAIWKRILVFPFFNGAASGLIWAGSLTAITLIAVPWMNSDVEVRQTFAGFAVIALYAFAYTLLALLIHRTFMRLRPPKMVGVIALILVALGALVPNIILFFLNRLTLVTVESLQVGNMFNVFSLRNDSLLLYHEIFAGGFLIIMIVLNLSWFLQQVKNFRPTPVEVPPPLK